MTRFELFRRNLWLTAKRSRTNAPSRRQMLLIAFWLLYVAGYGLLIRKQYEEAGPWGIVGSAVLLLLGVGVSVFIRRHNAHAEDSFLKLSVRESPAADDLLEHGKRLARVLLRTAVLVDRAGGESLYRLGKTPVEHVGICRRRTLDLARRPELWGGFSREEQDLLMSQEGSWEWEQVWPRVVQAEDVRVLRWVLRMDPVLVPFDFLEADLSPALEVTAKPESVAGGECLAAYDLRPEQTVAQAMASRCVGEGLRRGFITEVDPEVRDQLRETAERMAADEGSDLLIGTQTVARAAQKTVGWIATAAIRRGWVISAVIDYLNGPADGELRIG